MGITKSSQWAAFLFYGLAEIRSWVNLTSSVENV